MKKDYRFAEEVEQALPEIFEQFHQQVTPNFSKDDWLGLYEKVANGDGIAVDMSTVCLQNMQCQTYIQIS